MKLHRSSYNWVVFLDRVTDPLGWLLAFFDDYNLLISSTQIEREIIVLIKKKKKKGAGVSSINQGASECVL